MDDSDDENFVFFGSRLPDLEEEPAHKKTLTGASKQGKHVPFAEQAVTDEKGRALRFHGAFTGGFSAGYFNTVGSKEGWQPAAFVSSRSTRLERKQQRPEDFMDTEDLSEFGIAPQRVMTRRDFTNDSELVSRFVDFGRTIIPDSERLIKEIVVPTRATVGIRLLRKMGYRESGRSIRSVGESGKRRVVGCSTGPMRDSEDESEDEDVTPIRFRKKDLNPVRLISHDNQFGLGYRSLRDLENDKSTSSGKTGPSRAGPSTFNASQQRGKDKMIRGAAFGVGVLNEDEDDADDVYTSDKHEKYDFAIGTRSESDSGSDNDRRGEFDMKSKQHDWSSKPERLASLIEGFEHAKLTDNTPSRQAAALYPLPVLPANYTPKKPFNQPLAATSTVKTTVTATAVTDSSRNSNRTAQSKSAIHTAHERSALLGEGEKRKADVFASERQLRFDAYCAAAKQQEADPYREVLSRFVYLRDRTEWELAEEREQFSRRYSAYVKPIHDLLRNRFVSSGSLDPSASAPPPSQSQSQVKEAEFRAGSKIDRRVMEWRPLRLLCKRFNVPPPFADDGADGDADAIVTANRAASTSAAVSEQRLGKQLEQLRALFDDFRRQNTDEFAQPSNSEATPVLPSLTPQVQAAEKGTDAGAAATTVDETTKPKPTNNAAVSSQSSSKANKPIASLFDVLDEKEDEQDQPPPSVERPALKAEKPPVDLFKAIFTDSEVSEDEEEEEEENDGDGVQEAAASANPSGGDQRNVTSGSIAAPAPVPMTDSTDSEDGSYGPAPPPTQSSSKGQQEAVLRSRLDEEEWLRNQKNRQERLQRVIAESVDAAARADAEAQLFEFVEKTVVVSQDRAKQEDEDRSHRRKHKHKRSRRRDKDEDKHTRRRSRSSSRKRSESRKKEKKEGGHDERKRRSSHSRRHGKREKRKHSNNYDASESDA